MIIVTPRSVTMITGPLYHVGGIENYTLPTLAAGGSVVTCSSGGFSILRALEVASAQEVTDLLLFPNMIRDMLATPGCEHVALHRVRRVFTGGDAVLPSSVEAMRARHPQMDLVQVYGLTEGTPVVACGAPGFAFEHPEQVGRAFPFAELTIRDDDGAVVADGLPGEIWTRSPANAVGYWNDRQASAETLAGRWCRTGDLGIVEDGALRISGRKKDMIVAEGQEVRAARALRLT
ncbi:long-chain fatty acid--CoA ligase [Baekduia soli]|uniref:Long-chain fatty acid--CoA ligase n=1 Tax=Baekduia soli TaxID=496014 RepID=A0A5B8U767_9ACTN|nr:fatty acid--CoA ligase family protein [Baekduia soli]QEC48765.1 long-chain fatty acid--CoA ligase [Baekduia soli]